MFRYLYSTTARNCVIYSKRFFLTNAYQCRDNWNSRLSTPILTKVNLTDFYNLLDQNYSSKGVINAIDVDIYANAIKDATYLDELRDLLHKLRMSADTCNTLESTHHATVRNYIEFGAIEDLLEILKDPLNYGIFLDYFTTNILLDKLLSSEDYEKAAAVASLVMLQEDYNNEVTCTLSQYACYKFILNYEPPVEKPPEEPNKKVIIEELKIRVKYLRNPYFDDHFDIKDPMLLAGKSLAWISENGTDNLSLQLQLIGWFTYKKYEKLLPVCEQISKLNSPKVYPEVLQLLQKNMNKEEGAVDTLEKCYSLLNNLNKHDVPIEEALKISIENAINRTQKHDITAQEQLFKDWLEIREAKIKEQTERLDRAKRLQNIQEKQKLLSEEEQKLWFFENEEALDLIIEKKDLEESKTRAKVTKVTETDDDENYVPPEITRKRK